MSESIKESIKERPKSLIKIGDHYLKQMKELADAWFKEKLMLVELNKDKMRQSNSFLRFYELSAAF